MYDRGSDNSIQTTMASQVSPQKPKDLHLPISRVKTIMKSSPYVDTVGQDCLFVVAKATELFIHHLTAEAHSQANKGNNLEYKHLAEVVQTNETLDFLREIMPRKITVKEFKEMMSKETSSDSSSSGSTSDSDSDSDSDSASSRDGSEKKGSGNGRATSSSSDESAMKNGEADDNEKGISSESEPEDSESNEG